jgi:hypothetical protein
MFTFPLPGTTHKFRDVNRGVSTSLWVLSTGVVCYVVHNVITTKLHLLVFVRNGVACLLFYYGLRQNSDA